MSDTNAFARFARAHLPSAPERSIYRVLAATADRAWAVAELAAAAGVTHHDADQALRRFAAAGIVHDTQVRGRGHRYRWHPEMAYLRAGTAGDRAVDPVCGMPVPPGSAHVERHADTEVSFCSRRASCAGDRTSRRDCVRRTGGAPLRQSGRGRVARDVWRPTTATSAQNVRRTRRVTGARRRWWWRPRR